MHRSILRSSLRRSARLLPMGRGLVCLLLAGLPLLSAALSPAGAENLPDFEWRRTFHLVHGALNRNEVGAVLLSIDVEGDIGEIPVAWRVLDGGNEIASADTLIPTATRSETTVFLLQIPALDPGNYVLEVETDPQEIVEEKDERNNRATYGFNVPDGAPVRFRCEGPEGTTWELYRVELSTADGDPYPDDFGTMADTSRSTSHETVVNGVEPGDYVGVFFGPTVNRRQILISSGSFTMPDPPEEIEVVWQRTTPYLVGRPKISGDAGGVGGENGAPRWQALDRYQLDGTVRNPDNQTTHVQWMLRFLDRNGYSTADRDTLLYVGALGTEGLFLTGRIPEMPGNFLMQAEVRVPWPMGFEDLGEEDRAASFVLPLGWIEVER